MTVCGGCGDGGCGGEMAVCGGEMTEQ
jgi:hypothetical protein